MEPTYNYKLKLYFTWPNGELKTAPKTITFEDINSLHKQIEAYNKIKLELAKTYGEVTWFLIKDFVKRPIMAWSLEQRLLEPVKDYIDDCKQFVTNCNTADLPEDADLYKIDILKTITTCKKITIDIPKTSEKNKINKIC